MEKTTTDVDAKEFYDALVMVSKVVGKRNTIPILGMVLVNISNYNIELTATNLDAVIRTNVAVSTEKNTTKIAFNVAPKPLLAFLRGASGALTIITDTDSSGNHITIVNGEDIIVFGAPYPPENFPRAKLLAVEQSINIPEMELHRLLKRVCSCVSTEVTRYYLNGIYVHAVDNKLALVATDGHKLMLQKTEFGFNAEPFILPTGSINLLLGMMDPKGNNMVEVTKMAGNNVFFATKYGSLATKTIDGAFPDYTRVIPKPSDTLSFTVKPSYLRRFTALSKYISKVEISPIDGTICLHNRSENVRITVSIPFGKGPNIGFNLNYLKMFTKTLGDLVCSAGGAGEPLSIKCEDPNTTAVLMPMRL